jgi:hypothetical protein
MCDLVTVTTILAAIKFILEGAILLISNPFVLTLNHIRKLEVQFPLELVLKDLHILDLVDILLHYILHFHKLFLELPHNNRGIDALDDHLELTFGIDEFLFKFVVVGLN